MVTTLDLSYTARAASLRRVIDDALEACCRFDRGCPTVLGDAIRYALLAPGKRLRPTLVLLAAEACGQEMEAALPAACAVEMIHSYSLVHDDLPAMDDDDLRRGLPTCHKQFGEGLAILAGDALLTLAFEVLARDVRPASLAARCVAELARAAGATALVGGQADDLRWSGGGGQRTDVGDGGASTAEELLAVLEGIHRRKTGAMICVSLRLGGLLANANAEQLAALTAYGERVGLAFQIIDDLLDASGAETHVGKRVGKDAALGKLTFPGVLGEIASRRRAEHLIEEAIAAIAPFGGSAEGLESLARFVLDRTQ